MNLLGWFLLRVEVVEQSAKALILGVIAVIWDQASVRADELRIPFLVPFLHLRFSF